MARFLPAFLALFVSFNASAAETAKANLTILADETLLLPLAQLARHYATESKTPLTIVVKSADDAERQIEQGLEAQVIITANRPLLDRLSEQGLTDVTSRKAMARTQLALVSANDFSGQANIAKRISFAAMLAATPTLPVLIDDVSTIEGERAQHLLAGHEFSQSLAARAVAKPNHDELIASLHDEPSLGLVLAADTTTEPDIRVLSLIPDEVSPAVTYETILLGGESMVEAKTFTNYLSTREARGILAHFGYQAPLK